MVAHPRAAGGPGRVRPLNRPRPIWVDTDVHSQPVAVYLSGCRYAVEAVLETWRIDDEWWRQRPVSRVYFRLLMEDGRALTACWDTMNGRWSRQNGCAY